ncbi:alpha-1,3/1,6-mannosyltransferase ALG2-like isoform X3 [Portunus trituberculatus]|uniref:alpha-1,3/1,6-mannosyltransferase ALG2-like isoform X3 n=1 Tax=Portunus trituberculatus TaxID=210409 RepID=UPI001E1D1284|nr:alpha-1,3/1,6-mannosyltransferase ALG2-like isoform X3 [Portunus trituberculatus]
MVAADLSRPLVLLVRIEVTGIFQKLNLRTAKVPVVNKMVIVAFVHPDLGIGGAERLVVDAALALRRKGHQVYLFTAHHDPTHCFPETTDGQLEVTCVGDWLPRSICGRFMALWAYLRMVYVALYLVLVSGLAFDVVFVDQVSACIPFLRLRRQAKILFYCHFPDQLLTQRSTVLKKLYRYILDTLEECTTRQADCVLVNSYFTASVYHNTFPSIGSIPSVLYPSLDFDKFDRYSSLTLHDVGLNIDSTCMFLSLNRFERKKNLNLALESFSLLVKKVRKQHASALHLVLAGGYDHHLQENVEHYCELINTARSLGIMDKITFLKSPEDRVKVALLRAAKCLLYTPDKEHFGIVPVEAMYLGTPVIAVNSGGPRETVVSGETGILTDQAPEAFAEAMETFVTGKSNRDTMGTAARNRVISNFSFVKFSEHLNYIIQGLMDERKQK